MTDIGSKGVVNSQLLVSFNPFLGATLGKGLNRALATLLACALGVGAHYLASTTGKICEPLLLGFFVFVQGTTLFTYSPSLPCSKNSDNTSTINNQQYNLFIVSSAPISILLSYWIQSYTV